MADHGELLAYRVLLHVVEAIVDEPNKVEIGVIFNSGNTTFRLRTDDRDIFRLIGKGGKTSRSIAIILAGIGHKANWKFCLSIDGQVADSHSPMD